MIHKKEVEQVVSARTAIMFFQITGFFFIKVRIEQVAVRVCYKVQQWEARSYFTILFQNYSKSISSIISVFFLTNVM